MCGIAGMIQPLGQSVSPDRLRLLIGALSRRGPDGEGTWIQGSVGLAHRRLAIVDLSPSGAQPMQSADGSLCITFNGEIYNYQALRLELEAQGCVFVSTSDTEVLLHLYQREGAQMLSKLHGMFAFALWDAPRQRLFFARDRLGKKPFYYQSDSSGFSFASELKALTALRPPSIDWNALRVFFGLQYVPSPQTGFLGIASLLPGHFGLFEQGSLKIESYDVLSYEPLFTGTFEEASQEIRRLGEEAVRLRLIADVPVGSFLSGGIDSSLVTALASRLSSHPLQTFTMGFSAFGFDERPQAEWFAKQLGTEHHAFEAKPEDATAIVDLLVDLYDAPYADSSALPSWLLARATHPFAKAVLCGDGGDELFGGYRRYRHFLRAASLKGLAFSALEPLARLSPAWLRFFRTAQGLQTSFAKGYAELFTGAYFSPADERALLQPDFLAQTAAASAEAFIASQYQESLGARGALAFDARSYLPDDLNVKMDRASMAHGLEVRSPFLDQNLAKFSATLPLPFLLTKGASKRILRSAFRGVLPDEIFTRPKRGFQVPLAHWFRHELRPLFLERCCAEGSALHRVCRVEEVRRYLQENDRGIDHGNRLWMLLVTATWLQRYV